VDEKCRLGGESFNDDLLLMSLELWEVMENDSLLMVHSVDSNRFKPMRKCFIAAGPKRIKKLTRAGSGDRTKQLSQDTLRIIPKTFRS
jgi:hypothetical protein